MITHLDQFTKMSSYSYTGETDEKLLNQQSEESSIFIMGSKGSVRRHDVVTLIMF